MPKFVKLQSIRKKRKAASCLRCVRCEDRHITCVYEYSAPCSRCVQDLGNAAGETCILLSAEQRREKREKLAGREAAASSLLGLGDIGSQSPHTIEGPGEEQEKQCIAVRRKPQTFELLLSEIRRELEATPIPREERRKDKCHQCADVRIAAVQCNYDHEMPCSRCRMLGLECLPRKSSQFTYSEYWDVDLDMNSKILWIKRIWNILVRTQADFQGIGADMLLWAAAYGRLRMVELVLRASVDVECRNVLEEISLHVAARNGHCTVVEALLRANASVLSKDDVNNTPLSSATQCRGRARLVGILLAAKADVKHSNDFGNTPLHLAVETEDTAVVELLLAGGGNFVNE